MKIAFPMEELALGRSGGVETYARNLIRLLQKVDRKNSYTLLCSHMNEEAFPITANNFAKQFAVKNKTLAKVKYHTTSLVLSGFNSMGEMGGIKNLIKKTMLNTHAMLFQNQIKSGEEFQLLHFLFSTVPTNENFNIPVVLTIHDIQQEYFPELFSRDELKERRRLYINSAERASHIIAISEFTKKTLVEMYNIDNNKISVIYEGYDQTSFQKLDNNIVKQFRDEKNLPDNFILYPAATWKHKNHINLIRGYKILKDQYGFTDKLILTGIKKENHSYMEKEIIRHDLKNNIIHLGYLNYDELPRLFNAARLMVFPSLFEGFGLPVVEANAVGLPVICSNTTSLPEIAGNAAVYFNPEDPSDIAETLYEVYNNKKIQADLIKKGYKRAKQFSWQETARKTVDIYRSLLNPG